MDENANQDENNEENRVPSGWQNDGTLYEMRSHRGGREMRAQSKRRSRSKAAHNSSNNEGESVVLARLDEKSSRDGNGELSAGEKSHDSDGNLLQEKGEKSANKAEHDSNGQSEEGSRFVHNVGRQFDARCETDRRDAEPEYAAPKK